MDTKSSDKQKLEIPSEIRLYLENLLEDAGMTSVDIQMKEEMINQLYVRLDSFITTVIIDAMPEENIEEFIQMNEQNKPQTEIAAFLNEKLPNSKEVFSKAFTDFRQMYLGNVRIARQAPEPQTKPSADTS